MSILAFGGEMGFFVPSDSTVVESTSNGKFNSSFARCATQPTSGVTYADSPILSAAQADFWLHLDWSSAGTITSTTKKTILELLDSGNVAQIRLTADGSTTGVYEFSLDYLLSSVWTSVGTFTMSGTALQTIDIHVVSNTASGSANLYVAGTQRIASGTINLSGFSGIKKGRFYGRTVSITAQGYFSQIIMASESTIGLRVGTIVMTGQGATHTFTAGGYANIDETVYSDADEINSDTNAQVELFTGTPVPSFTGYTIRAIGVYARAKNGSGIAQIQMALRSGGTTYFSSTIALDVAYGAIGNVWELNPNGSVAWLSTDISTLQYGVKSIT